MVDHLFEPTSEDAMAALASLHHHMRMRWPIILFEPTSEDAMAALDFFFFLHLHDTCTVKRLRKC